MAYIDQTFYDEEYKGVSVEPDVFSRLAERSSDIIDQITSHKIPLSGRPLDGYSEFIKSQFMKAVAAQVEYMVSLGGELTIHGGSPSSVNIGNFSYSEGGRQGRGQQTREQQMVSPAVIGYLKPTGLLYKGLTVYDC